MLTGFCFILRLYPYGILRGIQLMAKSQRRSDDLTPAKYQRVTWWLLVAVFYIAPIVGVIWVI